MEVTSRYIRGNGCRKHQRCPINTQSKMNSLAVLAVLVVAAVEAMPQAATTGTPAPTAAVPQATSPFPGFFFTPQGALPSSLLQMQAPFLTQAPGVAGQPPTLQQVIPVTSFVVRPLSEAEQNALAHQEFQRIWEAQATRNLAIPQLQAAVAAKTAAASSGAQTPAGTSAIPTAVPTAAETVAAPLTNSVF
ncbi:uncharacterized protein [Palaemon carinicauda]|uniref:uncharacterized protein n=1 Tax=Palaemon carinicauda TaxID=392227 RepID=UPI0035B6AAE2